jgi:hypothetical protein
VNDELYNFLLFQFFDVKLLEMVKSHRAGEKRPKETAMP